MKKRNKEILFCGFIVIMFCICNYVPAQTTSSSNEEKLKMLMEKKADYHKRTDGEYDGYRIKIHFGIDKTKAREIKSKFLGKFPEYGAYEEYQQPNFVIVVGDFRTRAEAFDLFKKIQGDFPNAFIIKDKIRPLNFSEPVTPR